MFILLIFILSFFVYAAFPATNNTQANTPNQNLNNNNPGNQNNIFSNSINYSNVKNRDLLKEINFERNNAGIQSWFNSSPEARSMMEKLLLNYGLISPNKAGDESNLALPSPQFLSQTVEESLAVHESFKNHLKKLLHDVQKYLAECSVMIYRTVIDLESYYNSLVELNENIKGSSSDLMKTQYIKELLDVASEAKLAVKRYNNLKKWKEEITGRLQKNL